MEQEKGSLRGSLVGRLLSTYRKRYVSDSLFDKPKFLSKFVQEGMQLGETL
jgi:hypothetical protein